MFLLKDGFSSAATAYRADTRGQSVCIVLVKYAISTHARQDLELDKIVPQVLGEF